MKMLKNNPNPPIRLYTKSGFDTLPESMWLCGECRSFFYLEHIAADCCRQNYCQCGKPIEYKAHTMCSACADAKKLNDAELISDWQGPICTFDKRERFFSSLSEMYDYYGDSDLPEYVAPCDEVVWGGIDVEDILNDSVQEMHADASDSFIDVDELESFVEKWCEKQSVISWFANFDKKIKVDRSKNV